MSDGLFTLFARWTSFRGGGFALLFACWAVLQGLGEVVPIFLLGAAVPGLIGSLGKPFKKNKKTV